MHIRSMSLENYRCYKKQEIEFFPYKSDGILSVVEGEDRSGKTTIFNAIGWCLFGEETSVILEEPPQDLGIPSVNSIMESEKGSTKVEVVIEAGAENGISEIRAIRTANFNGSRFSNNDLAIHIIHTSGETEHLRGEEAKKFIEGLVSRDLLEFYMFNGEYLKRSNNFKGKNIESAIKGQFKFGALTTMERRLVDIYKEYGHKRTSSTDENALQDRIDSLTESIEENTELIGTHEGYKNNYMSSKKSAEDKLTSIKSRRDQLIGRRNALQEIENDKKTLSLKKHGRDEASKEFWEAVIKNAYIPIANAKIMDAYKAIKLEMGTAGLPPNIKDEFVKDILNRHQCICGTTFEDGSKEDGNIRQILKVSELESRKAVLTEISPTLNSFIEYKRPLDLIKSKRITLVKAFKEENEIDASIRRAQDSITNLTKEESRLLDDFVMAQGDIEKFGELAVDEDKEIGKLQLSIESSRKDIEELNRKIQQAKQRNATAKKYDGYKEMADNIKSIITELKGKIIQSFVELLEAKTNSMLSSISGLSNMSVKLNGESGALHVAFADSSVPWGDSYISEGQNQIISIIFIAAFSHVLDELSGSTSSVPFVVMDHPFSDLGQPRKEQLLEEFGNLFKETRVIMMIPPGDFNIDKAKNIISKIYKVSICDEDKICRAEVEQ